MLENLDAVAWDELEQACGVASSVPRRIRVIDSSRGAKQESAIDEPGNDISHHGSDCPTTGACVPFTCEIMDNPHASRRKAPARNSRVFPGSRRRLRGKRP